MSGAGRIGLGLDTSFSGTKPFSGFSQGPTVSPYLNLFRTDANGSVNPLNYNTLVEPQLRQQQLNQAAATGKLDRPLVGCKQSRRKQITTWRARKKSIPRDIRRCSSIWATTTRSSGRIRRRRAQVALGCCCVALPLLARISRFSAAYRTPTRQTAISAPATFGSSCVGLAGFATSSTAHLLFLIFSAAFGTVNSRRLEQAAVEFVHGRGFRGAGWCHAQRLRFSSGSCRCDNTGRRVGLWCAARVGPNFVGKYTVKRFAAAAE